MSAPPSVPRAHTATGASTDDVVDDGPLFRAHLASLERRATNLRQTLKKLLRALEASLAALAASANAHAALDDALEDLSAASLTSQSDVLGGLYKRELRARRSSARDNARAEADRGKEMVERVKGAVDRIKAVEDRRKAFDADSKRYYDDLSKYLSRGETDPAKVASLDTKQAERAAAFRQLRIDFFSFLEGLVESEERAVASWLRAWANVTPEDAEEHSPDSHRCGSPAVLDGAQLADRDALRGRPRPSAGSSVTSESWCHIAGLPTYLAEAVSGPGDPAPLLLASDDGHSVPSAALSRTTTGGIDAGSSTPSSDNSRRRRSSLPVFVFGGNGGGAEKEKEPAAPPGKRDRLKGFFRTAQHSISSALPTSASSAALADLSRRPSPPSPTVSHAQTHTPLPPLPPASSQSLAPPRAVPAPGQPRKKEGFLYATETGQKHTTAGDSGQKYHRYWVTLSEGQLVEYARWTDAMQVHGTPINLLRASARISRQAGDRRFVFEVLTPELRRVYQAGSERECQEWVAAIQKSVESLLNGTSSVRHFDASRLQSSLASFPPGEIGSSSSSLPNSVIDQPTSPRSRFPPFLSRRASAGQHSRKTSQTSSKKDKRRSVQHLPSSTPPIPSLSFERDGAPDRSFFDAASRRGMLAFSESDAPSPPSGAARPRLSGLGIPFPGAGGAASRSTPDLHRAPSPGGSFPSSRETIDEADARGGLFSPEGEHASSDAVRTWALSAASDLTAAEQAKHRNAVRIAAVAARAAPEWDNARCADCRTPEPRWASWNLGVTLCILCSGTHRSLGTHVSKVRSVELDDWNDEQLERMERVGNALSNAYFEARLPPGTVESLSADTIASFIREKYVDKRWAPVDDPHASPPASTIPLSSSVPRP
ncbi:hypothetical protein JCM3770_000928 [Rhodotorula araucariae]